MGQVSGGRGCSSLGAMSDMGHHLSEDRLEGQKLGGGGDFGQSFCLTG